MNIVNSIGFCICLRRVKCKFSILQINKSEIETMSTPYKNDYTRTRFFYVIFVTIKKLILKVIYLQYQTDINSNLIFLVY